MEEAIAALAYYTPVEYERFKSASDDPDVWHDDYDAWRLEVEATIKTFIAEGGQVEKVQMNLDEFQLWCAENERLNESAARSEYAARKCQEENEDDAEQD